MELNRQRWLTSPLDGPETATGVLLTDALPGGVFLGAPEISAGNCSEDGRTIACAIGDLARDDVVTSTVVVVSLHNRTTDNGAAVRGSEPDTLHNNSASASIGL